MAPEKRSPMKKIRQHCLSCCGGSTKEVRYCPSVDCHLWEFRFGKSRKAAIRQLGASMNESLFREGEKYAPDKSTSAIEIQKGDSR